MKKILFLSSLFSTLLLNTNVTATPISSEQAALNDSIGRIDKADLNNIAVKIEDSKYPLYLTIAEVLGISDTSNMTDEEEFKCSKLNYFTRAKEIISNYLLWVEEQKKPTLSKKQMEGIAKQQQITTMQIIADMTREQYFIPAEFKTVDAWAKDEYNKKVLKNFENQKEFKYDVIVSKNKESLEQALKKVRSGTTFVQGKKIIKDIEQETEEIVAPEIALSPNIAKILNELADGQISDVIEYSPNEEVSADKVYCILKRIEKRPMTAPSLDEVKPKIIKQNIKQKQEEMLDVTKHFVYDTDKTPLSLSALREKVLNMRKKLYEQMLAQYQKSAAKLPATPAKGKTNSKADA